MSLLLQALQKAAKNRSGDNGEAAPATLDSQADLSLEPLAEPQLGVTPEYSQPEIETKTASASSREQAANIMQANETPNYSALDWVNDHHMLSFLALAALFAIFYGLYVYMQVANPGMFRSPPPVTAPIQTAAVAPPIASESVRAQISGLPDAGALADTSSSTQMTDASGKASVVDANSAKNTTGAIGPLDNQSGAADVIEKAAPRPTSATRPSRARSRSAPVRRVATDSEGVEIIEIPASPRVSALPSGENASGQNISVRQRNAAGSQLDSVLMLAYEAMQQGNYEKAGTLYNQVLTRDPNSIDALLGLAAIAWKQGRTSVASQHYGRVLELEPRNSYGQAGLIALLGNADPTAAESKLKQLIGREPTGFLYFTLGNLYAEQGKWSRAQQAYFQAFQFQPNDSDYAFNLAVSLEHLGQTRPALQYYRIALDLSFAKGRANFDQGLAIERVGQLSARVD